MWETDKRNPKRYCDTIRFISRYMPTIGIDFGQLTIK